MRVTIEFGSEIDPAIQNHLDEGTKVQTYIKAAINFFNKMLVHERAGQQIGFGDAPRFETYNQIESPLDMLERWKSREE